MTSPERPMRLWTFAGVIALFCVLRLGLCASLADVFFYGEELEKGTAAKALIDGVPWPYHRLAYHPYEGGGFVISHLLSVVFRIVGESILAHKLVALAFGGLVLAAGMKLTRRLLGDRGALVFGVLFALAPESFQKLSLLCLGIHFEASLFLLLVLDATLALLEESKDGPFDNRLVARLGLALGFGFYFNYQLAVAGLWSTLWLLAVRPRVFTGRSLAVGLTALASGLLPLAAMASRVGMEVFDIHGTPLGTVGSSFGQVPAFLRSLYVDRPIAELVLSVLYPAAFVFGLAVLLRSGDPRVRARTRRLVSFLVLWLTIYLFSGFAVGEVRHFFQLMRFAPVWVLSAVMTGAGLADACTRDGAVRLAGRGAVLALALAGAFGTWSAAREGSPGTWRANLNQLATTKGYDYAGYFAKVFPRLEGRGEWELALDAFREPVPELLCADYAQTVTERGVSDLAGGFARLPLDWQQTPGFLLGFGALASRLQQRDITAALGLAPDVPAELRALWGEAIGRFGNAYAEFPGRIEEQLAELAPGPQREAFLRGTGYRIWRRLVVGPYGTARFQLKPRRALVWMGTLAEADRPALVEGFERARRVHSLEPD